MSDDEIVMQPDATENHDHAYPVRNMLVAAGMEAEARTKHQILRGVHEVFIEAPWYVMVAGSDLERARDLAERWRIRFEASDGASRTGAR